MAAVIELQDVTKRFGSFRALDNVSLKIQSGVTALLGPNGAGKSTLIKVLLGLLRTNGGRGRLLDFEIGKQNGQIRANVGYMPEDDCYLFGLTGVESVQLSARLSRYPAIEGLRRAHEILDYCGTGQERYRAVETYSTGMRQKLRFAQALVHDPPVIILDEPTSGLDPDERTAMLNRIRLLAQNHGKTVLLSTHILPDVQAICDAVVVLARGRVRVADRLEELSRPSSPSIELRLLGSTEKFLEHLRQQGLVAQTLSNGTLVVEGPLEQLTRQVWQIARDTDVSIASLVPAHNSLEEIFLHAVREQPNGSA